jgi:hypothetical protein
LTSFPAMHRADTMRRALETSVVSVERRIMSQALFYIVRVL